MTERSMLWGILVLFIVIAAVHIWDYKTEIQEYSFAQPATIDKHDEISRLLQEKIPLAVEVGPLPFRPEITDKSYLSSLNGEELAAELELTTGLVDIDAGRPWWWAPQLRNCSVEILGSDKCLPLKWVTAERSWIGCSSGAPLSVWLVHGRYRKYLPTEKQEINPWTATVSELPWWGRVQFVEVTVKPGWSLSIPAHWGFAARPEPPPSPDTAEQLPSWIWTANQHSLVSLAFTSAK